MPSKTITVTNGDGSTRTITIPDRSRFAGVRNISRAVNALPLTDSTTSIQVTVAGHANISGIYTGTTVAGTGWTQQGGSGSISVAGFDATDGYTYLLEDSDTDPQLLLNNGAGFTDRPWKAVMPSGVTITGIAGTETLTVNRTAPVITSDRKGKSRPLLSKLVGGAAAAYSLRDLNDKAGNNKVVRVRRASDNHERDFLAKEVSNGTLQNWVNTQTALPLDLQALTDDGRTGDFLIAKAAYSLRSLGTRQATLAATGDTVARADGKYVVQVRRSSDDALKSFTADEVTDGTLLAFVNEDVTIYQSDYSAGTDGWTNASSSPTGNHDGVSDSAGTSKDNVLKLVKQADSQAFMQRDQGVVAGLTYTVSGSFLAPASNTAVDGLLIKDGTSGGISANYPSGYLISDGTWTDFSFSYTATVSGLQRVNLGISSLGANPNGSSTGSTGDIVYIADLKFVETTSNGFVKTWYDQSVTNQAGDTATGNHAVQATPAEQPLIVSAGSLILNSDGHPAIGLQRTGSVNTMLDLTSGIDIANSHSFQYVEFNKSYTYTLVESSTGGDNRIGFLNGASLRLYRGGAFNVSTGVTLTNNPFIYTTFLAADGSASKINVNGNEVLNQVLSNGTGGTTFNNIFRGDNNGQLDEFTKLSELIVYDTDQSDNRTALEANIGEAYSITGIPAYDNTVDGFVETWYDQSGENFNMTQAESTKQPKIVDNGTFLGSVKYDGATSYLKAASYLNIHNQAVSLFTVQTPVGANDSTLGATHSGRGISFENSVVRVFVTQSVHVDNHVAGGSGFLIGSAIHTGDGSSDQIKTSRNGVPVVDPSPNANDIASDGQPIFTTQYNVLGGNRVETSNSNFFTGEIKEVVIWKTNQLANRPAIEANINNQYDIY